MTASIRNKQIDYFINNYNFADFPFINDFFDVTSRTFLKDLEDLLNDYDMLKSKLAKRWKENPEWRYTQALVNTGIVPNTPGMWYYTEDWRLLELQNIDLSRFLTWTSVLNKKGELLKTPKVKFLYELDKDHIESILKTQKLSLHYRKTFEKLIDQ